MAITTAYPPCGPIEGSVSEYQNSTVFKGIPYALPPVGERRWKAPEPMEPWAEPFKAFQYGSIPLQRRPMNGGFWQTEFYPYSFEMSEDCLTLNVITPAEKETDRLPVVIWIYGGGFMQGYAHKFETDGQAFAKRGIVYVSINYRLGVMGYLVHEDLAKESPYGTAGNYGLLDQIAAIYWVKENIAAFGGDPDRITLMGQSAGAMSIYDLMACPSVNKVFRGAIMESGGGLQGRGDFTITGNLEEGLEYGRKLFDWLGIHSIAEARAMDGHALQKKALEFDAQFYPGQHILQPVMDGKIIPEYPFLAQANGDFPDIPVIIGCMGDEMRYFGKPSRAALEAVMRRYYRDDYDSLEAEFGMTEPDFKPEDINYFGDQLIASIEEYGKAQTGRNAPVYAYFMTNIQPGRESFGAFHSGEHFYVFQTFVRSKRPFSGKDLDLSNDICEYWSNFIKTGDPNAETMPKWEPYGEHETAMEFNRETGRKMVRYPETRTIRTLRKDTENELTIRRKSDPKKQQ